MIDFENEFSKFVSAGDGSAIRDIYSIIPALNNEQIKVINALVYYIKKYELLDLKEFLEEYKNQIVKNKNLNLVSSMNVKSLLKAYTQDELIRGIKVNSQQVQEK